MNVRIEIILVFLFLIFEKSFILHILIFNYINIRDKGKKIDFFLNSELIFIINVTLLLASTVLEIVV